VYVGLKFPSASFIIKNVSTSLIVTYFQFYQHSRLVSVNRHVETLSANCLHTVVSLVKCRAGMALFYSSGSEQVENRIFMCLSSPEGVSKSCDFFFLVSKQQHPTATYVVIELSASD
jgi:hypothetical protein